MTAANLRSGDCLLYKPNSFWSYAIALKTWNAVSHCEAFLGAGRSVASRDGIGVNVYDTRLVGLATVLRPNRPFDLVKAQAWFATVQGERYDWKGLLRFVTWGHCGGIDTRDKMFCSEFLTRWYRAGGLDPFHGNDADAVAPATFLYSPFFDEVAG